MNTSLIDIKAVKDDFFYITDSLVDVFDNCMKLLEYKDHKRASNIQALLSKNEIDIRVETKMAIGGSPYIKFFEVNNNEYTLLFEFHEKGISIN